MIRLMSPFMAGSSLCAPACLWVVKVKLTHGVQSQEPERFDCRFVDLGIYGPLPDLKIDILTVKKAHLAFGQGAVVTRPVLGSKRLFDVGLSIFLLPVFAVVAIALVVLNPFLNRGPLMYYQRRMGLAGQPFQAWKFRTMMPAKTIVRGAFDGLEEDRIAHMGRILRKARIDELPQIINVLRGEMSLIGPRPDLYEHACIYMTTVPGYAARHQIMPGISGYAQTQVGYVDGEEGVQRKVAADLYYIGHANLRLDLWILWRTLCVIAAREGR